jgi:regulator of sirC expression with transglutaminase-like and TPR domain
MDLPPDGLVNVGLAALYLAKERYPHLNIAALERRIDELAFRIDRAARELKGKVDRPEAEAMKRVLYDEEGFRYDLDRLKRNSFEPGYLSYLLDTRQGDCLSMTTLCIVIAQRLGWSVYPVNAPGHVFLRYVGLDGKTYNIEPTSDGESLPDEFYTQNLSVSPKGYEMGAYLRHLRDQEFLALLLGLSATGLPPEKAIPRLEKAVKMDPTCASCYMHLSGVHHMQSVVTDGEESLHHDEEAQRCSEKAEALGWVSLEDTPLWKRRTVQ